ncbi:MAG: dephospho-CoA kinase [Pseudomonadota bacterium]
MSSDPRYILGLTGSLAMGKSTTAQMFRDAGIPVWDADASVHALYAADAPGSRAIAEIVPGAIGPAGVDRAKLVAAFATNPALLPKIEARIHPLVAASRKDFLQRHPTGIVVLDVPLLFETGGESDCDGVVVVTAPSDAQRARALARPGMTPERLDRLLARQMPGAEKRRRADFVIDTALGLEPARHAVHNILEQIRAG